LKKIKCVIIFSILLLIPVGIQNASAVVDTTIGEIMWFGGTFAPSGFALCDGQLLAISDNPALFSLIETTYGGDGRTTFALPEMRGRLTMHEGTGPGLFSPNLGAMGGTQTETLSITEMPSHTLQLRAFNGFGDNVDPAGRVLHEGIHPFLHRIYSDATPNTVMGSSSLASVGGSQSHNNMPPFLAINCLIALLGGFQNIAQTALGEIRFVTSIDAQGIPPGWAECDGQTLLIADNQELFNVLGTTHGGNGVTTFELPDMRGRMLMGSGPNHPVGDTGGVVSVTLTPNQIPSHTHTLQASNQIGNTRSPSGFVLAMGDHPFAQRIYRDETANTNMNAAAISFAGGSQAHNNMPPFKALKCIIAISGTTGTLSESYVGEIRWLAFEPDQTFLDDNSLEECDGGLLPLFDNISLFSIFGTIYGGDGRTTLGLPDLEDRFVMHSSNGPGLTDRRLGEIGGTPTETITTAKMPSHNHQLNAFSGLAQSINPSDNVLAIGIHDPYHNIYNGELANTAMDSSAVSTFVGGEQSHTNIPPFLALKCVVVKDGTSPF